jgi:hypothetical protein
MYYLKEEGCCPIENIDLFLASSIYLPVDFPLRVKIYDFIIKTFIKRLQLRGKCFNIRHFNISKLYGSGHITDELTCTERSA